MIIFFFNFEFFRTHEDLMKSFSQLIFLRVKNEKVCEKFHLSKFESHQSVTIFNFIKMKLILASIGAVLGEQCYEVVVLFAVIFSSEI